jgi:hypothetical protein
MLDLSIYVGCGRRWILSLLSFELKTPQSVL